MSRLLAIDPGPIESAYCEIALYDRSPRTFGKVPNEELLGMLESEMYGLTVIEMIASYGMAVGADVFETCVWIGRYIQRLEDATLTPIRVKRHPVKLHHCHNARATDANIRQALVDRFAPGQPNHGKGSKAEPGWFYGGSSPRERGARLRCGLGLGCGRIIPA